MVDEMLDQWRSERPDLDTSGMGIALRILFLGGVLGARLKETLAPAGLAPWEFDVLSALRRTGGTEGLSPTELCEAAQLTSGAMTHRIDRLEERRLVRRRAETSDRRSVRVTLTAQGRKQIDRVIGARMVDAADFVAGLNRSEQRQLASLLRRVTKGLEAESWESGAG